MENYLIITHDQTFFKCNAEDCKAAIIQYAEYMGLGQTHQKLLGKCIYPLSISEGVELFNSFCLYDEYKIVTIYTGFSTLYPDSPPTCG